MSVKHRIDKLERKIGIGQPKLVIFIQKFIDKDDEIVGAYDTAESGGMTFRCQYRESKEEFEKRIAETVRQESRDSIIVVHMGEAGDY